MNLKLVILYISILFALTLSSCRYKNNDPVGIDSVPAEIEIIEIAEDIDSVDTSYTQKRSSYSQSITLREYVENLRNDGMTMFHIEGDNVLVFTRWDDPVGGNADSQAESLYRQAKAAHVRNIKTVRIMKMPEKKIIGRYVSRK